VSKKSLTIKIPRLFRKAGLRIFFDSYYRAKVLWIAKYIHGIVVMALGSNHHRLRYLPPAYSLHAVLRA
jgi:hypothetical protein